MKLAIKPFDYVSKDFFFVRVIRSLVRRSLSDGGGVITGERELYPVNYVLFGYKVFYISFVLQNTIRDKRGVSFRGRLTRAIYIRYITRRAKELTRFLGR